MKHLLLVASILTLSSCLFQYDDVHERKIIDSFYLTNGAYNCLIKKDGGGTSLIVIWAVDSIAWDEKTIYCVARGRYFLIDSKTSLLDSVKSRDDLLKRSPGVSFKSAVSLPHG